MADAAAPGADLIAETVSPFETIPPGEAAATEAIRTALVAQVRANAISAPPARRDAHPKPHGCVRAEFQVLADMPPTLRQGLFAEPRTYQAWIRYSNGSDKPQKDAIGDARGMALKVMGVEASPSGTQDFLMINTPVLFVRNAVDYVDFITAKNPLSFFFPSFNPFSFRIREMIIARSITSRQVSNMLNIRYWSVTPYLFGDRACKFSAKPIGPLSPFTETATPDFLHDNLVKSLAQSGASFDFCVQLQTDASAMPVEDPRIEWKESASPFVPVARITIAAQSFDTPEGRSFCENLSFTPWHGLAAHRPLGGINRVRRSVYETISTLRHDLNGAPRREPTPETAG